MAALPSAAAMSKESTREPAPTAEMRSRLAQDYAGASHPVSRQSVGYFSSLGMMAGDKCCELAGDQLACGEKKWKARDVGNTCWQHMLATRSASHRI